MDNQPAMIIIMALVLVAFGIVGELDYQEECRRAPDCTINR